MTARKSSILFGTEERIDRHRGTHRPTPGNILTDTGEVIVCFNSIPIKNELIQLLIRINNKLLINIQITTDLINPIGNGYTRDTQFRTAQLHGIQVVITFFPLNGSRARSQPHLIISTVYSKNSLNVIL